MKHNTAVHSRGHSAAKSRSASRNTKANPEVRFMTEMIDHHQMAVTMSEKHLKEAEHAELKQLCENIITSQRAEIEQMKGWLREWHGIEHTSKKRHARADGSRSKH